MPIAKKCRCFFCGYNGTHIRETHHPHPPTTHTRTCVLTHMCAMFSQMLEFPATFFTDRKASSMLPMHRLYEKLMRSVFVSSSNMAASAESAKGDGGPNVG
jgi:hypothetical protein